MENVYIILFWVGLGAWCWISNNHCYRFRGKLIKFVFDKEGRRYPEWWYYTQKKQKWYDEQLSYNQMANRFIILQRPQRFIKGEFAEKFLDRMEYY